MDDADLAMEGCVKSVCGGFCGQIPAGIGITMKAVYTDNLTYSTLIEYEEFLIALLSNNYSHAQIKRACEQLNLPFSQDALNDALALIEERLTVFKTQIFNDDWFSVFIDAYHARLRAQDSHVVEISLFSAVGVTTEGKKHILGFWIYKGNESKGFWTEVFQQLITRGVNRVLLFVTDNFPGIAEFYRKLKDNYLAFLKYPQASRKFIYTSNAVESINAGIEKMRLNLGGYFPSSRALEVNLFIQMINLEDLWERKPIAQLKECLYEIRQLFDLRFEMKET